MSVGTNIGQLTWTAIKTAILRRAHVGAQLLKQGLVIRPEGDLFCMFPNLSDRILFVERFARIPGLNANIGITYNLDWETLGTGSSSDDVTFDPEGGVLFTTDSSAAQEVIVTPHLDSKQSALAGVTWGTDQEVMFEASIKTGAALADVQWAGLKLTNTAVVATDADQAFFRFTNTGTIKFVYSIGGTDTEVDTGVTAVLATVYRLRIIIDSDRIARAYINGSLVATSTALTDAIDLIPYVGVQGNAKTMTVRHIAISRNAA